MNSLVLYINTSSAEKIVVSLIEDDKLIANKIFFAKHRQSEKLLVSIDRLIKNSKFNIKQINKIIVADLGESFTALRIGVLTANALAYALKIPVVGELNLNNKNQGLRSKKFSNYSIVEPVYRREANIGIPKKMIL